MTELMTKECREGHAAHFAKLREERSKQIYDILNASCGKHVAKAVIADKLGIKPNSLCLFMTKYFIPEHKDEIKVSPGFYMLLDIPEKKESVSEVSEENTKAAADALCKNTTASETSSKGFKNPEGYSDHTAGKAIAHMGKALAGEIWSYSYSNSVGAIDLVLVISSTSSTSVVLRLLDPKAEPGVSAKYPVEVRYSGKTFIADAAMPCCKPNRYFRAKVAELTPTQMNFVRRGLARALGIQTEIRTVEKPVEKIKFIEKPVEKIVEKIVEKPVEVKADDTIEIAVLRAEHALYKSIVDRLLERRHDDI